MTTTTTSYGEYIKTEICINQKDCNWFLPRADSSVSCCPKCGSPTERTTGRFIYTNTKHWLWGTSKTITQFQQLS